MELFTIGFTKTSAEYFFNRLESNEVKTLIDVRLNNQSQLAGFAKSRDLEFFLKRMLNVGYQHQTLLAPRKELLSAYRNKEIDWKSYETSFMDLIDSRSVADILRKDDFASACLLCSEETADQCHRRLVAEYLTEKWGDVHITHL